MNQQTKRSHHENGCKKVVCAACGGEFTRSHPKRVTCSDHCRDTPKTPEGRIKEIARAVSKEFGVGTNAIFNEGRDQKTCDARFCMYGVLSALGETKYTMEAIFSRHHSTLRAGLIQFQNLVEAYPKYAASVNRVKESIKV